MDRALLSDLVLTERIIAIVGLAKNTGKTVCLNRVIEELSAIGRRLGVTSIGRDGEKFDALNAAIRKPLIWLPAGSLVSSTISLLEASGVLYTIVKRTGARTAMGEVVVAEVKSEGTVEVLGPSTITKMRQVAEFMLDFGVDQVLVDGALNRKASCSPSLSDAVILSTGAVLNQDPQEVVALTSSHVKMLSLPLLDSPWGRDVRFPVGCKALGVSPTGELIELSYDPLRSLTNAEARHLCEARLSHLVVKNALSETSVDDLSSALSRMPKLVVQDSSRLFVSPKKWRLYERMGLSFLALRPTRVLGVTVNPVCPAMYSFPPEEFLQTMQGALEQHGVFERHCVFDLLSPSYREPVPLPPDLPQSTALRKSTQSHQPHSHHQPRMHEEVKL